MKNLTTAYKDHLAQSVTTLAKIVKIVRKDTTTYLYTDHDQPVVFSGETYSPLNSFIPTDFQSSSSLAVDNLDITGIINESEGIKESDINKEYFYDAKIYVSQVNYTDPDTFGQDKILYGSLGELTLEESRYIVEFRSMTYPLQRSLANVFSKTCRVEFGSSECGIDVYPSAWTATTEYCDNEAVLASVYDGRRYVVQSAGTSGATEPTWDTTVGNTTVDGSITWVTREAYTKEAYIHCPTQVKVTFLNAIDNTTSGFRIEEVRFFDETDTRVYASSVTGTTYYSGTPPSNMNDNDGATYHRLKAGDTSECIFNFASPFRLSKWNIEIENNGNYCTSIEMAVSYDGGSTWIDIEDISGTSSNYFWAPYSYVYEKADLELPLRGRIYLGTALFTTMNHLFDGRIIFTSGNNLNLGMEITNVDSSTEELYLFNPMPESIKFNDSLTVTVGCNHLYIGSDGTTATGDCDTRFNNGANFRGEPFVPTEDILVGGIGETNKEPYTT